MAAKPKPKPKTAAKPAAKAARAAAPCTQIVRISRQQRAAAFTILPVPDCKCECKADGRVQSIFKTKYKVTFRLDSVHPCDETDVPAIFPIGTEMLWEGQLTVRREQCTHDAQPSYFGSNSGKFAIRRGGSEIVFTNEFRGTVGVSPSKSADERCCAHGTLLGTLSAPGLGGLKGWTLYASFDLLIYILDRVNLCEPGSNDARLNLDGVLTRICSGDAPKKRK